MKEIYYTATQAWRNGMVVSSELSADEETRWVSLRIQGTEEDMLCDIEIGEMEAVAIINVLSSAITKGNAEINDAKQSSETVLQ